MTHENGTSGGVGSTGGSAVMLYDASASKSCDECASQEGRHYCLLHGITLKNMDTIRCRDFSYRKPNVQAEPRRQ